MYIQSNTMDNIRNNYSSMSLSELEALAYRLQIDYEYPLTEDDKPKLVDEITKLRSSYIGDENVVRDKWIKKRENDGRPCHNENTVIIGHDVNLKSDAQLVFMADSLPDGNKIHYCLDREEDVDYILEKNKNPFTSQTLTIEQKDELTNAKFNSMYPKIQTNTFIEEADIEFGKSQPVVHTQREFVGKMKIIEEYWNDIGLIYSTFLTPFCYDYTIDNYNFFLKHRGINKSLPDYISNRDSAVYLTLTLIIDYITDGENINKYKIYWAMREFSILIRDNLTYELLIQKHGKYYSDNYVKELMWKPVFMKEKYNNTGNILRRTYYNNSNLKHGNETKWYPNTGKIESITSFRNGMKSGTFRKWIIYDDGDHLLSSICEYLDDEISGPEVKYKYPNKEKICTILIDSIHMNFNYSNNNGNITIGDKRGDISMLEMIQREGGSKSISMLGCKRNYNLSTNKDGNIMYIWYYDNSILVYRIQKMKENMYSYTSIKSDSQVEYTKVYDNNKLVNTYYIENGRYLCWYTKFNNDRIISRIKYQRGIKIYKVKYDEDGKPTIIGNTKDGLHRTPHPSNSSIIQHYTVINGEKYGVYKEYDDNSRLMVLAYYNNNKLHGTMYEYDIDGHVIHKNYYNNGTRCTVYHNGKLYSYDLYSNNKLVRKVIKLEDTYYKHFDYNDESTIISHWIYDYNEFYNNAFPDSDEWLISEIKPKKEGICNTYRELQLNSISLSPESLKPMVREFYKDDKLHGKRFVYKYINNRKKLVLEEFYVNGVLQDEHREYYCSTSNLKIKSNYKNGKLDGDYEIYLPNGKIKRRFTCFNGILLENDIPVTATLVIDRDVTTNDVFVTTSIKYVNGIRENMVHRSDDTLEKWIYDDDGREEIVNRFVYMYGEKRPEYYCTFYDGKKHGTEIYYNLDYVQFNMDDPFYKVNSENRILEYDHGKLVSQVIHHDYLRSTNILYNDRGMVQIVSNLKDDKLDGDYIEYDQYNQISFEGIYHDGIPINFTKSWDRGRLTTMVKHCTLGNIKYTFNQDGYLVLTETYRKATCVASVTCTPDILIETIPYVNGIVNGKIIKYDMDSNIISCMNMVDGLKHGSKMYVKKSKYYDMNIVYTINYNKGLKHGSYKSTYDYRYPCEIKEYQYGMLVGNVTKWYPPSNPDNSNGIISSTTSIKNGLKDGMCSKWYSNSESKSVIYYKNGLKHGSYSTFWENGKIKVKDFYENGYSLGPRMVYDLSGRIVYESTYTGYTESGEYKEYDEFGNLKISIVYSNNIPISYESYGSIPYIRNIHPNGILNNVWVNYTPTDSYNIKFYETGEIKYIAPNVDDEDHGLLREFHKNGNYSNTVMLNMGNQDGIQRVYDIDMHITRETLYTNGHLTQVLIESELDE